MRRDARAPTNAKPITVDGASTVQTKPGVESLIDDRVTWTSEELPSKVKVGNLGSTKDALLTCESCMGSVPLYMSSLHILQKGKVG